MDHRCAAASRRDILALMASAAAAPALAQEPRPLLVFAAASLQTSLAAVAQRWQSGGRRVTFSFAASSALARQLGQGAPADIFASADLEWMDWVQERGLIRAETRRSLLGNRLVLIAPADSAANLSIAPGFALAEAIGDSRLATGNVQSVPVGRYARQALTSLGVWDQVGPRIAGVDNVRAALALVARGEARFGIVYETDARTEPRVRVIGTFPPESHAAIVYPFALTAASTHPEARAFLTYLTSPDAIRIFETEGFSILR